MREKHSKAKEPLTSDFPNLGATQPMPPVVIGATVVKAIATQLSGTEGLIGLDSAMAKSWLLCFGTAFANVSSAFAELAT